MIRKILSKALRYLADNLDKGNTNMTEEEMLKVIEQVKELNDGGSHMSKYMACRYLHISRSTFDRLVSEGVIPKGERMTGFKELSWKKSDLDKVVL